MKWLVAVQPLLTEEEEAEVKRWKSEKGGRGVRPVLPPDYFTVDAEDEMGAWQAARARLIEQEQEARGMEQATTATGRRAGNIPRDSDVSVAPMRTARIRFSTVGSIDGETWNR